MSKNVKLLVLGAHGLIQVAGGVLAFITWRLPVTDIVSGYLVVTGFAMMVYVYNNLVVKVYLKNKPIPKKGNKPIGKYLEV